MIITPLNLSHDTHPILERIGIDRGAYKILGAKMQLHTILIEGLLTQAANILKQDALSIGADVAVPRGVISCETPTVDALLIGTTKHMAILAQKERAQPFGLREVARYLEQWVKRTTPQKVEIMGIVNANHDSFYAQSRFEGAQAVAHIRNLIAQGASIIDLGGLSSRPGSTPIAPSEELARVAPIIDAIYEEKLFEEARFSIDSYAPLVMEYALSRGFRIVNDITGLADDAVCSIAARHGAQVVIMHMQGTPQTMQTAPTYEHLFDEIHRFFEERIAKAKAFGIEDIVLDVGIGFGKTLAHNVALVRHLEAFSVLGYPLLVGASRKSLIDALSPSRIEERLAGTLALHLEAVRNGASILRCHDVFEHAQALRVHEALQQATIF
ncbi:MAG: dihydropteroate synthase [Sulfuricurvum sp. PC08-66]|nr:MAG: dihydropteroate synthase [Sulfuricurvum sp. PC08-66]